MNNLTIMDFYKKNITFNRALDCKLNFTLNDNEYEHLRAHSQLITFTAKSMLFNQGQKIDAVYLILKGKIQIIAKIMGQSATALETLNAGDFLTGIGFIGNGPCRTSCQALTDVICLVIPNKYFELLATESPKIKYIIFRAIAEQFYSRLKILHDRVISTITDSEMTSLSLLGKIIFSFTQPKKIDFDDPLINRVTIENLLLFKSFSPEELDVLINYFTVWNAPKNCKLTVEGEKKPSCFLIIYGAIQSCVIQENKLAKLSVIGPGKLVATIDCIKTNETFNFIYLTCEQTILCKLSETALNDIKNEYPALWYKLFNLICGSLTALKKSVDKLDIRLHIENYNR